MLNLVNICSYKARYGLIHELYLLNNPNESVLGGRIISGDPGFVDYGPISTTETYLEVTVIQYIAIKVSDHA